MGQFRLYSREEWWHDDADVQRFKGVQGKTGTYLLRLTDWSSHGILDPPATNDTLGRRIHSFCQGATSITFREGAVPNWRIFKSRSEIYPISSVQDLRKKLKTDKSFEQKWKLLFSNDEKNERQNNLKYTSATLKQRRRETRELALMPQSHEFVQQNETRKSRRQRIPSFKASAHSKKHQSSLKRTETHARQLDPDKSESSPKTKEEDNGTWRRKESKIRKHDYYNFLPEAAFLKRNDYHTRLSVRGTRVFGRRKSSRAFPSLDSHIRDTLKYKSISLPCDLQQPENHDYEFWSAGFVQSRVRRLEEDLASKWEIPYNPWNCDFEVQSLCSLDFGRIMPDGDDYRIAYLSSMGTSLESSLDYMEDSISAFGTGTLDYRLDTKLDKENALDKFGNGMGTLDVKLTKKRAISKSEDWDLSFSSTENKGLSSEEDDEFEFVRMGDINKSNRSLTYLIKNYNGDTLSNEIGNCTEENLKYIYSSDDYNLNLAASEIQIEELNNNQILEDEPCVSKAETQSLQSCIHWQESTDETISSQNEESDNQKCSSNNLKTTVPPKVWYEIRDSVDSKKLCRTQSNDSSKKYFKSSTWNRKPSKPLTKSNSFCFERNISYDDLFLLADSTRSKVNELFNYEPLSTPFAEIYAIECGKYTSETSCKSTDLQRIQSGDRYSSAFGNQMKHESDLDKPENRYAYGTDSECSFSPLPYETNFYQSNSIGIEEENEANKNNEKHDSSNLDLPSDSKQDRRCYVSNILEINKTYYEPILRSEINFFPLKRPALKHQKFICAMNDDNSDNLHNLYHENLRNIKMNYPPYQIQIFQLNDKYNNSPSIRSYFEKSPLNYIFPNQDTLKWAVTTFVNDIRHSREMKNLIKAFMNHLRRLSDNKRSIKQIEPQNQNYSAAQSELHNIETEVESVGEIIESGFTGCVTSQTGRTAFVEYPFPHHSRCARVSECNLPCGGSVLHLTVPAVQRLAKRESCPPNQWAAVVTLCSATTDGADECDRNSTCAIRIRNCSGHSIILDYAIDITALRLDYNYGDYVRFGCLPENLALLILGDLCDGTTTGFRRIMATCNDDPRTLGRVARTQGKNISKLMRLFDSNERGIVYTSENVTPSAKNIDNRTKSESVASQNVTEQQSVNNVKSASEICIQNGVSMNGSIVNDSESSSTSVKTSEVNENGINSDCLKNSENSSPEIPYCRKVSKNGLWENVNINTKSDSNGLWNSAQNHNQSNDLEQVSSSMVVASTTELNNLIASSRAELSKKKEPSISDKSNLESYFTSFENSKPGKVRQSKQMENSMDSHVYNNNEIFHPYLSSHYNCDMNEMNFEDEEAMLSDTSSEEDMKCHPSMVNTNYLPAYALHTIIEESCEESDSRTATPTNDVATSKLERYFSWDIINDSDRDLRKKDDDESTIYSDSLSESSNSLTGDDPKDIDPTQLASSRLEKYFTSGLVDDQNCYYPEDAEFLDDAPVSDFEEDSVHQKISRSALLSSLESKKIFSHEINLYSKNQEISNTESENELHNVQNDVESPVVNSKNDVSSNAKSDFDCDKAGKISIPVISPPDNTRILEDSVVIISEKMTEVSEQSCSVVETDSKTQTISETILTSDNSESISVPGTVAVTDVTPKEDSDECLENLIDKENVSCGPKPQISKAQLTADIQAIIKKLVSYFTNETDSESFKKNVETNYVSAWHILETEIERLLQSMSPHALENNSCNSSTIDSNNSDYGSDTIESMDCITDDDDIDAKNRVADILSSAYKFQSLNSDLSSFNISEETLSIWKRLIQSLQKDNSVLSENKLCDPNAEARLYIRDQIVTLMHTVTVNDNVQEIDKLPSVYQTQNKEISDSLTEENNYHPNEINEAFNVNVDSKTILSHLVENNEFDEIATAAKTESSDEGISDISVDNMNVTIEIPVIPSDCLQNNYNNSNDDSVFESVDANAIDESGRISNEPPKDDLENASDSKSQNEKDETSYIFKDKLTFSSKEMSKKDADLKFSVIVDIELGEDSEHSPSELDDNITCEPPENFQTKDTDDELDSSPLSKPESQTDPSTSSPLSARVKDSLRSHKRLNPEGSRDTGYYSFKSSDDSLINTSSNSAEFVDVPNFKSLKRTVKKFPVSNTLSKSTNNILQSFSTSPDAKFSTLQTKSKKSKNSSNTTSSPRQFSSLFSPSAVLKRFTGSKHNETPNPESSIPPKYLKKYARSISVDNESLFGAVSMPQLNSPRGQGDSYSALGLYSENDRDSSLILDDEADVKRYFSGSQSALSLGAHSASMNSVYSAAGCHYGSVTVSGDVLFGLNYNQKSQMMEVFIKECRNLAAIDIRHNKSNPYVKVYLLPDKTRSGKRKTKTKKNSVNPVFNELLRFPVLKNELESRTLWLSVWNSDLFGRNDFLGEISLPLGYRLLDSPTLRWYPLQDRVESLQSPLQSRGELFIALKYVPRDLSLESRFRPAPVISLRGALHVLVKEARNISAQRGSMDAFCKSYLLPDKSKAAKQKTPVVRKSNHPKWYYTVIYEDLSVEELRERSLELTVWDHDKIARNHFVGGVRLNVGTGLYHGVPVDWMDGRRDESSLWLSMLDSPNMWVDGCLPLRPTMHTQGAGLYS
ncbi:Synaptotagmin-like protein 5 [Araneus ventricosus]|uniref:Synaptotagmin-like protein 5 n=1 Tax=Araneus ventricosus TaxID=182803 RepID=A0A4Y2HTX5_ARAVE|nr:Synaptotagmin-like protein 5 [Araneus ventricosus]